MKIKRAVKCAAVEGQLKEILEIAENADIHGLEIQEILPLMEEYSSEERGKIIIKVFKKHPLFLNSLAYHFPLPSKPFLDDFLKCLNFDFGGKTGEYIFNLTKETIKEAALVGGTLNIKTEIPVVVHLFGFAKEEEITEDIRNERLDFGENKLKELKEIADYYSQKSGVKLVITRENNPPEHGKIAGLLDFHPKDIIRTSNREMGIGTNLDFAHIWLNILYWKNGKGELPGPDLSKKVYPVITLEETVDILKSSLKLIHLNDAGPGYRQPFEGLEIGKGNLPHSFLIPLICGKLEKDVIGTYEMKHGHEDPESISRSDQFYRNLFKEKFGEYFV